MTGASVGVWRSRVKVALASQIAGARGLVTPFARDGHQPLILGYHRVVEDFDREARTSIPSMLISRAMFEQHLDHIGRQFRFVSLDDIDERVGRGEPFMEPVAAVTFDDGYRDVYEHAMPILLRKGIPAAVFVITGIVGRSCWQAHDKLYHLINKAFTTWPKPDRELQEFLAQVNVPADGVPGVGAVRCPIDAISTLLPVLAQTDLRRVIDGLEASVGNGFCSMPLTMTWPMVTEMRRAGFTIGSHTRRHVSLPAEPEGSLGAELEGSRRELRDQLGEPIVHFAYPGGYFTPVVVEAVRRAGYRCGYTACRHGDRRTALTLERLILWERSSVNADGRFVPAVLDCLTHGLWPPAFRCERVHES